MQEPYFRSSTSNVALELWLSSTLSDGNDCRLVPLTILCTYFNFLVFRIRNSLTTLGNAGVRLQMRRSKRRDDFPRRRINRSRRFTQRIKSKACSMHRIPTPTKLQFVARHFHNYIKLPSFKTQATVSKMLCQILPLPPSPFTQHTASPYPPPIIPGPA